MTTVSTTEQLDRLYYDLVLSAPDAGTAIVRLTAVIVDLGDMCDTLAISGLDCATAAIAQANHVPQVDRGPDLIPDDLDALAWAAEDGDDDLDRWSDSLT